jgi:N-acetylneuraminic acid mutarotase
MKWFNCSQTVTLLAGIVAVIVLSGGSAKADTIWTRKADMPTPRMLHTSAVVNGKIYVIGGLPSEGTGSRFSTVEEFDPVTNTWTRKTDMPIARAALSSSVVNGRIYTIGGGSDDGHTIVEEYDQVTDTWTRKADMPTGRWSLATCAINGKIYAFGGLISSSPILSINIVEEYDPSTDTWTKKLDMPTHIPHFETGLWGLCANVVNERIYVLGGRPVIGAIPNVYEYDPATETWTRKTNMPVFTSQMASVALGDKIVVIGGWYDSSCSPHKAVQIYDPETDTWTREADTPFLKACFSANVVNNRIYVIGGTDRPHPCPTTSSVYELGPVVDLNADGIVDAADMCIIVDNWGTDEPLCDIGPMPWGDGIVDVEDLIVLAEHLFEEVPPVEPVE